MTSPAMPPTRDTPAARPRTAGSRAMNDRIIAATALIGALAAMFAAAVGYGRSAERIDATGAAVGTLTKRADDSDTRLRAVEESQATTAQALRDIAGSVKEMKGDLKEALKK